MHSTKCYYSFWKGLKLSLWHFYDYMWKKEKQWRKQFPCSWHLPCACPCVLAVPVMMILLWRRNLSHNLLKPKHKQYIPWAIRFLMGCLNIPSETVSPMEYIVCAWVSAGYVTGFSATVGSSLPVPQAHRDRHTASAKSREIAFFIVFPSFTYSHKNVINWVLDLFKSYNNIL